MAHTPNVLKRVEKKLAKQAISKVYELILKHSKRTTNIKEKTLYAWAAKNGISDLIMKDILLLLMRNGEIFKPCGDEYRASIKRWDVPKRYLCSSKSQ